MTILKLAIRQSARFTGCLCVTGALAACIQVRAPDKPIEINLNVKVQQEVVVRLQQDAKDLIKSNPELFPQ
jgi:hypothetical protein